MIKKTVVVLFFLLVYHLAIAQDSEKFLKSFKVSMFFGGRSETVDSFPNNENIDFMNYVGFFDDYVINNIYIGFKGYFEFKNNFAAKVRLLLGDVTGINVAGEYYPFNNIGFNLGFNTYRVYINDYSLYHKIEAVDNGLYGDLESNYRQQVVQDLGFYTGAIFYKNFGFFKPKLELNIGMASFTKFNAEVFQKQIDGNFKARYYYSTKCTFTPFFNPKLNLDFDIIKFKKSTLGMSLNTAWYVSKKAINYRVEYNEWTLDNATVKDVKPDKHYYSLFDLDAAIYLRW
jgi:hypothetical protein